MLDMILGEFYLYRKFTKGTWYYVRANNLNSTLWFWTRNLYKGLYVIEEKDYDRNISHMVERYV